MLLVALVGLLATGASVAQAHLLYLSNGWSHNVHGRNYYVYQGTSSVWSAQSRQAQIDWDNVMSESLRFDTVAHESSAIHTVDQNYGATGWIGYTANGGVHAGHAHVQLNLYYGNSETWQKKRQVACHEIGHVVGLAHSSDATDCMVTPATNTGLSLAAGHRDQLRSQYNSTGH